MCLSVREYEILSDFDPKFGREADPSQKSSSELIRESGIKPDLRRSASHQYWNEASLIGVIPCESIEKICNFFSSDFCYKKDFFIFY